MDYKKRQIQKKINAIYNAEINPCKKEIKDIDDRIDNLYKIKKEKSKEGEPEIKSKKQEFNARIDALEDEKDKVDADWDDKWKAYHA